MLSSKNILLVCTLILLGADGSVTAQNSKDVVVLYNSKSADSKAVAEHYARKRSIPAEQILGLPLSTNTDISRNDFRESLQGPLSKLLRDKELWRVGTVSNSATGTQSTRVLESNFRYLVLCYGVPFRIQADPALREPGTDSWRAELRRNEASVDSELILLPLSEDKVVLSGPLRNPHFAGTNAPSFHPTNGVLLVTRLDGPSVEIAKGLVDKALLAEHVGLQGRAYIDIRNIRDPQYLPGDEALKRTAEMCRRLGYETVVETNGGTISASFPLSHVAYYAGWYDETVSGPFTRPTVEFMPGAFAYHLHSFSAASLRSTNRNWVGPLLTKGATFSMGTVDEPYLGGTPDMTVFTARFLLDGFTFGEAAFAAQPVVSWQAVLIGDPLFRAVARNPDLLHAELTRTQNPLQEWSWLRLVNANIANGRSPAEAASLLEELPVRKTSAVLTEKLADLYQIVGKPSSASQTTEQALKMAVSPNQRLRLHLHLADRLQGQSQDAKAMEQLEELLKEFPDYPGKAVVFRRLAALARNLGQTSQAEAFDSKAAAP